MCLSATQKGIIISASLLAALLVQPSQCEVSLGCCKGALLTPVSLSGGIPSSFLLVTPAHAAVWGYPGAAARLGVWLC